MSVSKYEKARIISARALQISMGAPVLVKLPKGMWDSLKIAVYEFQEGATPIDVKHRKPAGAKQEKDIEKTTEQKESKSTA
ncbi:MAG: DNA-directed RNA polymerase subunit K [Candidatus Diapherotrites archaeon]|nr:DNA-directed RNA polymerase subunit K [Candidatus Diapherotrites archaeon]